MIPPSSSEALPRARWGIVFMFAWGVLCAWVTFELVRGESLRSDAVSIPALALLVLSAVIGSRIFLRVQARLERRSATR